MKRSIPTAPLPSGRSVPSAPGLPEGGQSPSLQCTETTWRGEHAQRFDGVAGAVQDHVRGIEIDAQVRPVDILEKAEQHGRGLLAGFECEGLVVASSMVANAPDHVADRHVVLILPVFWNKADVRRDARGARVSPRNR